MPVSAAEFRNALRLFASGITIVAAESGGRRYGMTCTSFASVSLDPPLILVCLERDSHTLEAVGTTGRFAVSVLGADQEELARAFSTPGEKPFDEVAHHPAPNSAPVIDDAVAWLSCEVEKNLEAGDHHVVIARVDACGEADGDPLLYFDRNYRKLS